MIVVSLQPWEPFIQTQLYRAGKIMLSELLQSQLKIKMKQEKHRRIFITPATKQLLINYKSEINVPYGF